MKRIFWYVLGIILLGVFGYTLFFLIQKSRPKPLDFKTDSAFTTNIIKKTVATGSVLPRKEIKAKSIVSGIVEKLYFEPGQYIKEGNVIAKIRINPNLANLNNAENNLSKASISFEQAKIDFERNEKLYNDKVISFVDFNNFKVIYNKAKEDLKSAENNVAIVKEGAVKNSGRQSNLVKANASGMILDIPVKEGSFVIESNTFNDGTTVAVLADMNEMVFEGKIDESEINKIKKGMDIELTIGAIEDRKYNAKLEFISPKGETVDGAVQFPIKAAIRLSKNEFLRAGYSASADIILDKKDSVLAISEGLLQFGKDSTFVEIETKPKIYVKRLVKTGISDGINVEILEGITKKDKIKITIKEPTIITPAQFGKPK
jgi:HlyD family secretion protein